MENPARPRHGVPSILCGRNGLRLALTLTFVCSTVLTVAMVRSGTASVSYGHGDSPAARNQTSMYTAEGMQDHAQRKHSEIMPNCSGAAHVAARGSRLSEVEKGNVPPPDHALPSIVEAPDTEQHINNLDLVRTLTEHHAWKWL